MPAIARLFHAAVAITTIPLRDGETFDSRRIDALTLREFQFLDLVAASVASHPN